MADYPAMPFWTDAYLADTTHLTLEEHGAYLKLLIAAWRRRDCRLPEDDRFLAKTLGVSGRKWRALKGQVLAFWTRDDDGYLYQKKQKLIRENLERDRQQKRNAAHKSNEAQALKRNTLSDTAASEPRTTPRASRARAATATKTKTNIESSKTETPSPRASDAANGERPAHGLAVRNLVTPETARAKANGTPPSEGRPARPVNSAVKAFTKRGRLGTRASLANIDWDDPANIAAMKEQVAIRVLREDGKEADIPALIEGLCNEDPEALELVDKLYQLDRITKEHRGV